MNHDELKLADGLFQKVLLSLTMISAFSTTTPGYAADPFPTRPITVIVPYAAGGGVDVVMRAIARRVEVTNGATIVIENRPGAAGTLAVSAGARARPDGYTLVEIDHGTHGMAPTTMKRLPYDPVKDFQPITLFYYSRPVLGITAGLPARTIADLEILAKTRPRGLSYGSQGGASSGHLAGSMLAKAFGVPMVHVPYANTGLLRQDLAAGRVDMLFSIYGSLRADVEAGRVRALAVAGAGRLALVPNLPTMKELGYPAIELESWWGLAAPAGVDPSIVAKLNDMFTSAAQAPEVTNLMHSQGMSPSVTTPEQFGTIIKESITKMEPIIREAGAAAQ